MLFIALTFGYDKQHASELRKLSVTSKEKEEEKAPIYIATAISIERGSVVIIEYK